MTDGLISAVGSSAEVAGLLGDATEVVDFEGGTLCAGFVEPHSHVLLMAMLLAPQVSDCRSFNCPTWQDIEAVISERVAQTPAGEPILIYGLDPIVHDHPMPSRDELDAFTTSHPLVVIALSAHTIRQIRLPSSSRESQQKPRIHLEGDSAKRPTARSMVWCTKQRPWR